MGIETDNFNTYSIVIFSDSLNGIKRGVLNEVRIRKVQYDLGVPRELLLKRSLEFIAIGEANRA